MKTKITRQETDLQAIDYNLSLTPTERLKQHQASLETVLELEKAHKKLYAKPQSARSLKKLQSKTPDESRF